MKNELFLKIILCSLAITFILLSAYFLTPLSSSVKRTFFPLAAVLGLIFLILGVVLTLISRKEKGRLRKFLILTGVSAIAPFAFAVLHNIFYGLAIAFEGFKCLFQALHIVSFIISIIIAPVVFVVGLSGSVIFFKQTSQRLPL